MSTHLFSLIIPVFNEEEVLPALFQRLESLFQRSNERFEVILVNDGSRDRSLEIMSAMAGRNPAFKVINLSRNFGHQIAITAGLDVAEGAAVITIDADLQDPPEVILEMIVKWREGFDVVHGVRRRRNGETFFKKATAALYYRALGRLTEVNLPVDSGDFRLIDRQAVLAFRALREKSRYVRGIFAWIGYRQTGVFYDRDARKLGESKYPLSKMLKLAVDGIFSFSNLPLKMVLQAGIIVAGLSFIAGFWALYLNFTGQYVVRGWTSMLLVNSFVLGMQLIVLGIMGEYIGRISEEVKGRPLYFVSETIGFHDSKRLHAIESRQVVAEITAAPSRLSTGA